MVSVTHHSVLLVKVNFVVLFDHSYHFLFLVESEDGLPCVCDRAVEVFDFFDFVLLFDEVVWVFRVAIRLRVV